MEKKTIWLIIGLIIIVSALILRLGTPRNRWVCQGGEWRAQGHPTSLKPASVCHDEFSLDAELTELSALVDDSFGSNKTAPASSSPEVSAIASPTPNQLVVNKDDNIEVEKEVILISPQANEVLRSQAVIWGQARGNWFFEATLPLVLQDSAGDILATGLAQAQGDWLTSDLVSFQGTLTFQVATATPAELVIKKNNPSALSEHDAQVSYPVRLEP